MFHLVNSIFKTYVNWYASDLDQHYEAPWEAQLETLNLILGPNRHTEIGRKYRFADLINDPAAYARRVPVHQYEDLAPYFDRMLQGENELLFAEKPCWVATTSGTTGSTKNLLLSPTCIRENHQKSAFITLVSLMRRREDLQLFSNKNLLVGGAYKGRHPVIDVPVADISAVLIHSIPKLMRSFYVPDIWLATQPNYEDKIEKIAHVAAQTDSLTLLGGVPTWNLPLFRRVLEITGKDSLLDVWPRLRVFMHGGVKFDPYRPQFEALFPRPDFVYHEVYNATEGFFAVQDRDEGSDMLLLLNVGVYYEFVRWEDFQQGEYKSITLPEVELDEVYVMLISTCAGLYRYPMGDLITFTTKEPYRIRILGRTQEFINGYGEDLLRSEAEEALTATCEATGAYVRDYTVAPKYIEVDDQGCHQWFVEFERSPADIEAFTEQLDLALQARNYNYGAKRQNDYALRRLELYVLPDGFFRDWLVSRGKTGGQSKVPRLANHRNFAEQILKSLEERG
ncbi:MAG: GH3 auxin-responsive promoter family protein [Bacteroidota bacterium]